MSTSSDRIRCHGCYFEGVLHHRPIVLAYTMPDGSTVEGYRDSGWCGSCDGLRDIEQILDARQIQNEIDSLAAQRSNGLMAKLGRVLGADSENYKTERRRLEILLRMARIRRSPPRCLTCGETDVVALKFDDDGNCMAFAHSCGGRLYRLPHDLTGLRVSYQLEVVPLDVEGKRLDGARGQSLLSSPHRTDQWQNNSKSTTFTNRLGITITVTPEQVEELLAIGLSEKEVFAILTGDFEGVDEARIVDIIENSNGPVS